MINKIMTSEEEFVLSTSMLISRFLKKNVKYCKLKLIKFIQVYHILTCFEEVKNKT